MKNFQELLIKLNACYDAKEWANDKTIEQVVKECYSGDWLLWLAKKLDVDLRTLTLAKARCAKTVIHLMKDKRSKNAIKVAENFGKNLATIDELNAAYAAADAADDAAYAADAYDDAADKKQNQLKTANICRRILGRIIIKKVNAILNQN